MKITEDKDTLVIMDDASNLENSIIAKHDGEKFIVIKNSHQNRKKIFRKMEELGLHYKSPFFYFK